MNKKYILLELSDNNYVNLIQKSVIEILYFTYSKFCITIKIVCKIYFCFLIKKFEIKLYFNILNLCACNNISSRELVLTILNLILFVKT